LKSPHFLTENPSFQTGYILSDLGDFQGCLIYLEKKKMENFDIIEKINPLEFDLFCGIDTHKSSNTITIRDFSEVILSKKLPSDPRNLINFVKNRFPGKKIVFAYEAGSMGFNLYFELRRNNFACMVLTPSGIPISRKQSVQTDKIDSNFISKALFEKDLQGVRVPSEMYLKLRRLVHVRDTITRNSIASKQRIKSLLLLQSLDFPEASPGNQWSLKVLEELATSSRYDSIREELDMYLSQVHYFHRQFLKVSKEVRDHCKSNPELYFYIEILKSHPGIAWTISTQFLSRIGDPKHLKNSREAGHFLGLTPKLFISDDKRKSKEKGISKMGNAQCRRMLIQGSWVAIYKDRSLNSFFLSIVERNTKDSGRKKAIVAVARKITQRLSSMLINKATYKLSPPNKKK
jgi:transposase